MVFLARLRPHRDRRSGDVDIRRSAPQRWTDQIARSADVVVSMGCGDDCPVFPGTRRVDWPLADPAGQPIEAVRRIRDEINDRVASLIEELTGPCC